MPQLLVMIEQQHLFSQHLHLILFLLLLLLLQNVHPHRPLPARIFVS
jgi:hypothetical protein